MIGLSEIPNWVKRLGVVGSSGAALRDMAYAPHNNVKDLW
jgi:hypothetical protein